MQDYSKKDSDEASAQLVDTFLEGYKVAHTIGERFFTMSEEEIVKKQIERVKRFVSTENMSALPVIVTLHQEKIQFVENVPIVPIMKLPSFLDEFIGNSEQLSTLKK